MKTETCKLYSRDLWIFLPNSIKIDPYNFELYRFKVGSFFETQCRCIALALLTVIAYRRIVISINSMRYRSPYVCTCVGITDGLLSCWVLQCIRCGWNDSVSSTRTFSSVSVPLSSSSSSSLSLWSLLDYAAQSRQCTFVYDVSI